MNQRILRQGILLTSTIAIAAILAGCGRSPDNDSAPPVTTAPDSETRPASAKLTWPQGSDDFALNVCTSIGAHTIQGGGNSDNGRWNLVLDGNLLEPGDTGKLTISQKSDMSVVYDAKLTALTVTADGSFTGSGEDAAKATFTITGTCDVTW